MTIPVDIQNSILGLALLNQELLTNDIITDNRNAVYYSRVFQKPSNHLYYQLQWQDNQASPFNENTNIDVRIRTGDLLPYKTTQSNTRYTLDEYNTQRVKILDPSTIDADLYRWQMDRSMLGQNPPSNNQNAPIPMYGNLPRIFEMGTAKNSDKLGVSQMGIIKNQAISLTSGNYTYGLANVPKTGNVYVAGYSEVLILPSGANYPTGTNQFKVNYTTGDINFNLGAATTGINTKVTYYYNKARYDGIWNNWSTQYIRPIGYIANNVNHDYLQLRIQLKSFTGDPNYDLKLYNITISSLLDQSNQ
jgi:hypothetical protein